MDWNRRYVPSSLWGLVLAIKQSHWKPSSCIDVGVAWGTVELQSGFKDARHVLIEPNPLFADFLQERSDREGWIFHQVALSDGPGEIDFLVRPDAEQGGRVVNDGEDLSTFGQTISVLTTSLDELDERFPLGNNLLLKIDVEGHEGEVLRGATSVLKRTEMLIVETSTLSQMGATSSQIVAIALAADLHLVGFLTALPDGPHRRMIRKVDLVFVRQGGPLASA